MLCQELSLHLEHVLLDVHELLKRVPLEQRATKASAVIKSQDEIWL